MNTLKNESSRGVLSLLFARAKQTAQLMCGLPDYDAYVAHVKTMHPELPVPSYAQFFRERQDARYGRGTARCC